MIFYVLGIILIKSVRRIWKFYKEENPEALNTRVMCLHASAFGLYLFGLTILGLLMFIYFVHPTHKSLEALLISYFVCSLINLMAQFLLCKIFFDLGKKENVQVEVLPTQSDVEVAEFDEEAEMMARIWNSFNRATNLVDSQSSQRTIVSVKELRRIRVSHLSHGSGSAGDGAQEQIVTWTQSVPDIDQSSISLLQEPSSHTSVEGEHNE